MIEIEEHHFKTNHSVVGYVVSKSWQLPDVVCRVIQNHHVMDFAPDDDLTLMHMLAINMLAEAVVSYTYDDENHEETLYGMNIDSEQLVNRLLEELNFDRDDLKDIIATAKEIIGTD